MGRLRGLMLPMTRPRAKENGRRMHHDAIDCDLLGLMYLETPES